MSFQYLKVIFGTFKKFKSLKKFLKLMPLWKKQEMLVYWKKILRLVKEHVEELQNEASKIQTHQPFKFNNLFFSSKEG